MTEEGLKQRIDCWRCCPISLLEEAEADYERFGIEWEVGEHEECRRKNRF